MRLVATGQHVTATCSGGKKRFDTHEENISLKYSTSENALTISNLLAELFWHVSRTKHPQKIVFQEFETVVPQGAEDM